MADAPRRLPPPWRALSAWISERRNMQKSAIEEIKELKARMESMAEQAKAEALDKANEAIGVLRVRPGTSSRIA